MFNVVYFYFLAPAFKRNFKWINRDAGSYLHGDGVEWFAFNKNIMFMLRYYKNVKCMPDKNRASKALTFRNKSSAVFYVKFEISSYK